MSSTPAPSESNIVNQQEKLTFTPSHIITNKFNVIINNRGREPVNKCVACGVDIGEDNPRQYCMKTYCPDM